jgi:hypothetical protein
MGRNRKKLLELTKKGFKSKISKLKIEKRLVKCHTLTDDNYGKIIENNRIELDVTGETQSVIESHHQISSGERFGERENESEIRNETEKSFECQIAKTTIFADEFSKVKNDIKVNHDPLVNSYISKVIQKATVEYNFPRTGVSQVLKKLNPFFPSLPNDYRQLLGTPRKTELLTVKPGKYLHLGIAENICKLFRDSPSNFQQLEDTLTLDFFVDGVAIFQISKEKSFWVILSRVVQFDKIFPVGIYNGKSQPSSFNDLLAEFVKEIKVIIVNGLKINNRVYKVEIRNFCLDSPAKASVCHIVHPTGYKSCLYCKIEGKYFNNRVTFNEINQQRRTDEEFKSKIDAQHHKGSSILETELDLKMVSQFPPDYLHAVLLGATKKILKKWFQPIKPLLQTFLRKEVSAHLKLTNEFIPSDIHRQCRPIEEILTYHGNELRVFLLKVGHVVLRNKIPAELYENFLLLHCAITILCDVDLCLTKNQTAETLLKHFIENCGEVYGEDFVVSIIHACEHLAEAVKQQKAPLDQFSTFPFESFMTPIKKYLHTTRAPLPQIHRRVVEMMKASNIESLKSVAATNIGVHLGSKLKDGNTYGSVSLNGVKISAIGSRDRFLLTNNCEIVVCLEVQKKENEIQLTCRELFQLGNFYETPINSTKLNIYWCQSSYNSAKKIISIHDISRKMFAIPCNETSMVFSPLRKF